MRAVAVTFIAFIYVFSISLYVVDVTILAHTQFGPVGLAGSIDTASLVTEADEDMRGLYDVLNFTGVNATMLDGIINFVDSGSSAVWIVLSLLSGTYAFDVLAIVGVPSALILAFKLIFPLLVAYQVIWFLTGRY